MVSLMINKIEGQHIRFVAVVAAVAAAISAVSYVVNSPAPVWEGGKQLHTANFSAHLNGFPLPFVHTICSGPNPTCHSYFDLWGFIFNAALWAAVVVVGWLVFKRVT